jgi:hypothetical protein
MPCYHNAFVLYQLAYALDDAAEYWDRMRRWLNDVRDPLAEPQATVLAVDWFEDPAVVEKAWHEIVRVPARLEVARTRRVLTVCGPAPWHLKAPLLERVVNEPGWAEWILRALVGSAFDVYGQIDLEHARRLLARIDPPEDARGLAELRERLAA